MAYHISSARCPQNHACPLVKRCPVGAITQQGFNLPVIDSEKCTNCGLCYKKCPIRAVEERI